MRSPLVLQFFGNVDLHNTKRRSSKVEGEGKEKSLGMQEKSGISEEKKLKY